MHAHKFGYYPQPFNGPDNSLVNTNETVTNNKKICHIIEIHAKDNETKKRTFDPASTFKKTFDPPLEVKNCEISLLEITNDNILIEINKSNNVIEYSPLRNKKPSVWSKVYFTLGCYTPKSLYYNLLYRMYGIDPKNYNSDKIMSIDIKDNKAILYLHPTFAVRFTDPNSFGKVIGYSGEYSINDLDGTIHNKYLEYTTDIEIGSRYKGLINVHVDCVESSYINNKETDIVYSFNQQGNDVKEKPNHSIYHPIKDDVKDFRVSLTDKNHNDICLNDFDLKFHIKND